ncbi:MAG TPA: response regulator [Fibrobacteria bacterium]|nr:response regulator [Fibrobacteria bacterium]
MEMEKESRIRILLVDDSEEHRRKIISVLDDPRLDIIQAESGEEGLELLAMESFAVILLDVRMPGMNGFEFADRIRRLDPARIVPIMFITTTQVPDALMRKGYSLGAADFLVFPIIPEVFRAKVEFFVEYHARKETQARHAEDLERRVRERTAELGFQHSVTKASEDRYRRLFETAQDGILILDARAGRIVDANPFLADLLGYPREELLGKELWEIGLFRDVRANQEAFRILLEKGYARYEDLPLQTKSGQKKEVEFVSNVYKVGNEDVVQCNIRDITERKQAQEALGRSEAALRQSQKTEALGKLSGGIAHDFNNLLTAINGYSDLCLSLAAEKTPLHEYLGEILKAGKRASNLTHQLLAFSRKQILAPKILNLSGIVAEILTLLRRLIEVNIKLTPILEPDLWLIRADPVQINQVLLNLAVNARDAVALGGEIVIRTENMEVDTEEASRDSGLPNGQYILLSVSDTGTGMDSSVIARIFEPFYTTKDFGKGSGMGLAMVDGIVRQSGGRIKVESSPGNGSTFTIYLPRVEGEEEMAETRVTARVELPRGAETILLVEDDAIVRTFTRRALEIHGYEVLETEDGESAIRIGGKHEGTIHLLLTDILMAGINGRDLATSFRQLFPHTPVLFMSGYTDEVVVHLGLLEENSMFLQKPFSPALLIEAVSEALKAGAPSAGCS